MIFVPNTLVLFDVDGTLTEARQSIEKNVLLALRELARHAEIAFLTGSDLEYIKEQLWPVLNDPIVRSNCHLLPCNGTKYYIPHAEESLLFHEIHNVSMLDHIGKDNFNKILSALCVLQAELVQNVEYDLPLSGHFIQNRESMINWCPIGRNASQEQREKFVYLDRLHKIRNKYFDTLSIYMKEDDLEVTVKMGGNTSFDIYPNGWDKTYALSHFEQAEWDFWFVGDRCGIGGNDYEIFNFLKPKQRAFETGSPEETVEIIDNYILEELDKFNA
jgi:phosphomannomutase